MNRRNFIRTATVASAATLIAPSLVNAKTTTPTNNMAGGVYFTKENAGRWAKKVGGHLPMIEQSQKYNKTHLKITTAHEMNAYQHYIVKHILLDQDFNFIAEKLFDPTKDNIAVSDFNIGDYKGTLHVLSVCNKHDTWLNSTVI